MQDEEVLFHSDEENITVTGQRLIYGSDVTGIGSVDKADYSSSEGFKEYLIAVVFGVIGIALVFQFNLWSILGLLLLINPVLIFTKKKKYWVHIFMRSGGTLNDDTSRMFTKEVAKDMSAAVNTAVQRHRIENNPRKGLDL